MTKVNKIASVKTETGRIVSAELHIREDRSGKLDQLVAVVAVSIVTSISRWNDYHEEIISTEYVFEGEVISQDDILLLTPAFNFQSIEAMRNIMLGNAE